MKGVVIFMEGGGSGKGASKAKGSLRRGMDQFLDELKQAARNRGLRWKLVCCGSRDQAFGFFRDFQEHDGYDKPVLLVDAEGLVQCNSTRKHLQERDNWKMSFCSDDSVHLMAQVMETWISADPIALENYYGNEFETNLLSKSVDLEIVPKEQISSELKQATRGTTKGEYHKIRHASEILKKLDANRVRKRCLHCDSLFQTMRCIIQDA